MGSVSGDYKVVAGWVGLRRKSGVGASEGFLGFLLGLGLLALLLYARRRGTVGLGLGGLLE